MRRQFYPDEKVAFSGINTWRGVTRRKPILTGRSLYARRFHRNRQDGDLSRSSTTPTVEGNQLINWMAEIRQSGEPMNDWNKPGKLEDFCPSIRIGALTGWTWPQTDFKCRSDPGISHGRQGSRGPLDVRAGHADGRCRASDVSARIERSGASRHRCTHARGAFLPKQNPGTRSLDYEKARLEATAKIVRTNRAHPPDYINIKVDELTGGKPFRNIDDVISQEELRKISEDYKRIAGFSLESLRAS